MIVNLNQKFMNEISNTKDPEIFLGVARLLKLGLLKDDKTSKDFLELFVECVDAFDKLGREKKKELLKILKQANKTKIAGGGKDGDRTQNSEA